MEVVCKILGHSSISTTEESYGKVVQKRIGKAIERLKGSG